jgi:hypothetical protein
VFYKIYIVSSLLALAVFSYAQYEGWSLSGVNESKAAPGSTRNAFHK